MATDYTPQNVNGGVQAQATLNQNFTDIQTALGRMLNVYGDTGTGVNAMQVDLDMNSQDILNANDVFVNGISVSTWLTATIAGQVWAASAANIYFSSGNVSVGSSTSAAKFTVDGFSGTALIDAVATNSIAWFSDGVTDSGISVNQNNTSNVTIINRLDNGGDLGFATRTGAVSYERMRITSTGWVGIGELTPSARLHVATGSAGTISVGSNADELLIEGSTDAGATILGGASDLCSLHFGSLTNSAQGRIVYDNTLEKLTLRSNALVALELDTNQDAQLTGSLLIGSGTQTTEGSLRFDGTDVEARVDAGWRTMTSQGLLTPRHTLATASGLVCKYVTTTTVDIDADNLVLIDASGNPRLFSTINLTVDITTSGANGLDTGSEASDTPYTLWVVAKEDGTLAGLLSVSTTAPTMPTDYLYKGRVGFARNNSSSNLVEFIQRGSLHTLTQTSVLTAGNSTTFAVVDMSNFIPTWAYAVGLQAVMNTTSGSATVGVTISDTGSGTSAGLNSQTLQVPGLSTVTDRRQYNNLVMSVDQQLAYRVAGTNAQVTLNLTNVLLD